MTALWPPRLKLLRVVPQNKVLENKVLLIIVAYYICLSVLLHVTAFLNLGQASRL